MKQKTKNILLVFGFILVLVLAYQFSFSRTIETKSQLDNLKAQIARPGKNAQNILQIKAKELVLDSIISSNRVENTSLQNNLLNTLNLYSEKYSYKIISFKEPHVQTLIDSNKIKSFQFTLEGSYKDLERMVYTLEKDYSLGSISHINFEKKKDYRLHKNFLQCDVIVQNVE